MGDNSLTPARHKRETIDSRDKSTARLYHMIGKFLIGFLPNFIYVLLPSNSGSSSNMFFLDDP